MQTPLHSKHLITSCLYPAKAYVTLLWYRLKDAGGGWRKGEVVRAGQMAQWLRALAALPEDPDFNSQRSHDGGHL